MKTVNCISIKGNIKLVPKSRLVFRPSVYAVIIKDNQILMLHNRTSQKYFFPGGGIEIGETILDAIDREVAEETGLKIKVGKLLHFKEQFFYYDPNDEAFHMFNFFYICDPITNQLLSDNQVNDLESEQPRWYNLEQLKFQTDKLDETAKEVLNLL